MAVQPRGKGAGGSRLQESIASRKAKSSCRVCNQPGHWAGDPECRGPPRSAHIVDEEIPQTETLIADCIIPKDMEALPASTEAAASPHEHPDSGKGIVDTACARSRRRRVVRGLQATSSLVRPRDGDPPRHRQRDLSVRRRTTRAVRHGLRDPRGHREHPHEGGSVRHPELAALPLARPRLLQDLHAGHPLEVSTTATT